MEWYPHKTVATVVERDGRFLMVEEDVEGLRVFNQPAGDLEAGETLFEAAIRETLEETAWEVELQGYLGLYHYYSGANGISYIRSCFLASPRYHHPERRLDDGIVATHWMTPGEIRGLGDRLRSPAVIRVLEDCLAGKTYPLSVITSLPLS